jgi:hypothetical protein
MSINCNREKTRIYVSGNGSRNILIVQTGSRMDERLVRVIFVDETLLQIVDGKDYCGCG